MKKFPLLSALCLLIPCNLLHAQEATQEPAEVEQQEKIISEALLGYWVPTEESAVKMKLETFQEVIDEGLYSKEEVVEKGKEFAAKRVYYFDKQGNAKFHDSGEVTEIPYLIQATREEGKEIDIDLIVDEDYSEKATARFEGDRMSLTDRDDENNSVLVFQKISPEEAQKRIEEIQSN